MKLPITRIYTIFMPFLQNTQNRLGYCWTMTFTNDLRESWLNFVVTPMNNPTEIVKPVNNPIDL